MQLIHLLLSLLLRLMPSLWILTLPSPHGSTSAMGTGGNQFVLWIPLLGWVTVSVERLTSDWLPWRVIDVRRLGGLNHFSEYPRPKTKLRNHCIQIPSEKQQLGHDLWIAMREPKDELRPPFSPRS